MQVSNIIETIKEKGKTIISSIPDAETIFSGVTNTIRGNPVISGAVLGIGATGLTAGVVKLTKSKSKKTKASSKRKKATKKTKRTKKTKKRKSTKKKKVNTRKIKYTKKGQPYVLNSKGQAKFIKKKSAKLSKKRKGGRY